MAFSHNGKESRQRVWKNLASGCLHVTFRSASDPIYCNSHLPWGVKTFVTKWRYCPVPVTISLSLSSLSFSRCYSCYYSCGGSLAHIPFLPTTVESVFGCNNCRLGRAAAFKDCYGLLSPSTKSQFPSGLSRTVCLCSNCLTLSSLSGSAVSNSDVL